MTGPMWNMISYLRIRALDFTIVGAFVAVGFLHPAPASALTREEFNWCLNENDTVAPVLQIKGCTALIQSGQLSGKKLVPVYIKRGDAYRAENNYDRAIAEYSQAIKIDPTSVLSYFNRGIAFGAMKNYDRAIADYNEAIRLYPKYAPSYHNRGFVYNERKDYKRAIADYNEAIRLD